VSDLVADLSERAAATGGHLPAVLALTRTLSGVVSPPGAGRTAERWAALSSLGAGDLSAARVAEAHLDALAIQAEHGAAQPDPTLVWGVFAAEGPGVRVDAREVDGGWLLTGTKPWCSAADQLDRALITAHTDDGRRLFAVDLTGPEVTTRPVPWVSRGLVEVTSGPIDLDRAPATPVGETGWYLSRPGFAWGGIGVAACWYGGLVAVARRLWSTAKEREPDQIARMHLGAVDRQVEASRLALADAARRVDDGSADGVAGVILAERVRGTVASAAEAVVRAAGHALGPGPLAADEEHARRVADLQIYVRQHHAERDEARLGQLLLETDAPPW
jgi:alkylation response protein AidB-like acyl-CoA dehydrogenase